MGYTFDYEYEDSYIKSRRAAKTKVAAPPPPDDDDAKIARHEQQAAIDLRKAIQAAGEGGWRSPWYTGSSEHVTYTRQRPYVLWRDARQEFAETGDITHLARMRDAVDFRNPPGEHEIKLPKPSAKKRNVWRRATAAGLAGIVKAHPLIAVGVGYSIAVLAVIYAAIALL